MIKRVCDLASSALGLLLTSPLLGVCMVLVWKDDRRSPLYIAERIGLGGRPFRMIKLRSMVTNADATGVDSTSANDPRITAVGAFIRRYKLDELAQLVNVLKGDMSLVGPRPNVKRETDLYTSEERLLLTVRPGITDLASIVFADENEILADSADPDLDYNQLIRPWKSRLGLVYVRNQNLALDTKIVFLTAASLVSRRRALSGVCRMLANLDCDNETRRVAARRDPLVPAPPPGTDEIVQSR